MPRTLTSIVVHHSTGSISHSGPTGPMIPALLTSTSIGPSWSPEVGHGRGQPGGVGDVGDRGGRGAAGRLDELDGVGQLVAGAGDQGDRGAGVGEGPGDELTDASSGAGDERHRAAQSAVRRPAAAASIVASR